MTHPEIEAFLLSAKTGTITAAAEQLYVTQPALSRRIRSLEAELGYPCTVIATGGLASSITPYCKRKIICDDDLLLKGLWYLYQKNK